MQSLVQRRAWALLLVTCVFLWVGYVLVLAPPADFPDGKVLVIPRGSSGEDIAQTLSDARIIAHRFVFRAILRITGAEAQVQAGAYQFVVPQNVFTIARRLREGDYGIPPARVTFFEGATVRDFASIIAKSLPEIAAEDFIATAQPYEGYLFPDTYVFTPGADADSIVKEMRANFDEKTAPLLPDVRASGRSLADVVTLASLIEKEARTRESKRVIAGILWRRLAIGMPLQVDAVFGYIFNRPTYSPSYEDLKVESPYNTYTNRGLPPGPIGNPGLESIEAAIHPTKTPYLYYLTGRDGTMRYASTYEGHLANQRTYLPRR